MVGGIAGRVKLKYDVSYLQYQNIYNIKVDFKLKFTSLNLTTRNKALSHLYQCTPVGCLNWVSMKCHKKG